MQINEYIARNPSSSLKSNNIINDAYNKRNNCDYAGHDFMVDCQPITCSSIQIHVEEEKMPRIYLLPNGRSESGRNSIDVNHQTSTNNNRTLTNDNTTANKRSCCMSREFWTCFALSSIVIGLPIAIIIMLINLPRLSSQRDTRQQHYILLAFGLPFSCVMIVAILYATYSLIRRIRKGPIESNLFATGHHHQIHHHHCHSYAKKNKPFNDDSIDSSLDEPNEPKLYSLVTQVMSNNQQRNSTPNLFENQ